MKQLLAVTILIFLSLPMLAQQSAKQDYVHGKEMYQQGRYEMAMEILKPLTLAGNKNVYTPYASYYYSLSAFNQGYYYLGEEMLKKLISDYPEWENIDEAKLWLVKIYIREDDFGSAITQVNNLRSPDLIEKGYMLIASGVDRMEGLEEIKELFETHPNNKAIGEVLADRIVMQPLLAQDRVLLTEIVERFDLDKRKYKIIDIEVSERKAVYHVAVLLPFMARDVIPNTVKRNNQFILDIYDGIRLAKRDLEEQDIDIRLFAYDTEKSARKVKTIIKSGELNGMDLIIGPLYPETVGLVSEFSLDHKINMFNPLSTNSDLVKANPFSYLLSPTVENQAKVAAGAIIDRVENKNAFIFYENTSRDSLMAASYREAIQADSFNVVMYKKIKTTDTVDIYKFLTRKIKFLESYENEDDSLRIIERYDLQDELEAIYKLEHMEDQVKKLTNLEIFMIAPDSIGHIFVATDDELIGASTISGIETRGDHTTIVGDESWINFRSISMDQLESLNLILISPGYISMSNPTLQDINQKIIYTYNCAPNKYHYTGYELMHLAGTMMQRYGNYFQAGMVKEGFIPGELFQGFNYQQSNDNGVIPLIELKGSEFRIINKQ